MHATTVPHSLGKQLHAALRRSLEVARDETVKVMRFEALESRAELSKHALPLYSFTSPPRTASGSAATSLSARSGSSNVLPLNADFATGSDIDIGGLSSVRFGWDPAEHAARFWGILSSDIPRGARIERSGYAAFRNRNRPTLFGQQTWDTTLHPYLAIKVRNRLGAHPAAAGAGAGVAATPSSASQSQELDTASLRAAADAAFQRASGQASDPSAVLAHAIHALGLNENEKPGPRFFVNIQTDGPITSDLFQHRLFLDPNKLDSWQTVIIPFDSFVLTNTGTVSLSSLKMLREKIRTIGISAVLDVPAIPQSAKGSSSSPSSALSQTGAGPNSLRKRAGAQTVEADAQPTSPEEDDDWARDGDLRSVGDSEASVPKPAVRGSKRGRSFPFDLAIEQVYALAHPDEAAEHSD